MSVSILFYKFRNNKIKVINKQSIKNQCQQSGSKVLLSDKNLTNKIRFNLTQK